MLSCFIGEVRVSFLIAAPQLIADAASNLANLGSTIGSANFAAVAATSGVMPAAADEVSAEIASLFSAHAAGYQQLSAQAAAFHEQFVQVLTSGAATYASAEANVVQTLASATPALGIDFSGGITGLEASLSADLAGLGGSLNAALSGSLGGSLSGLAPLGATLTANLGGGLTALEQTGANLATSIGTGISGLGASLTAGLPGITAGLNGLSGSLNAALSGGLGASLAGLGPLGANLAAGLSGGLSGLAPLGAALTADITGLGANLSAAFPGLAASLSGSLNGLSGALNAALGGTLGAGLPGLSAGLSGLLQTGANLAANLGAALPTGLPALLASIGAAFGITPSLGVNIAAGLNGLGASLSAALNGGLSVGLSGLPTLLANAIAPFQTLFSATTPAAFLTQLGAMETAFNTALYNGEINLNLGLSGLEASLETALFGGIGAFAGVPDSIFDFWNTLLLGVPELGIDSVLGLQLSNVFGAGFSAPWITTSLLVGQANPVLGSLGTLGGVLAAVDDKFLFDLTAIDAVVSGLTGGGSLSAALTAGINGLGVTVSGALNGALGAGGTGAAVIAAPLAGLQGVVQGQTAFFGNLGAAEAGFNANLVANELGLTAGLSPALGGAVNAALDIPNLILETGEQVINSAGAGLIAPGLSLATAGGFNGVGGLEGILNAVVTSAADLGATL
jgi:PE family